MELIEITNEELFGLMKQTFPEVSLKRIEDNRDVLIHLLNKIQRLLGGVPWKK
jgi:hypothetical protein